MEKIEENGQDLNVEEKPPLSVEDMKLLTHNDNDIQSSTVYNHIPLLQNIQSVQSFFTPPKPKGNFYLFFVDMFRTTNSCQFIRNFTGMLKIH